jgi:hypothetical protein
LSLLNAFDIQGDPSHLINNLRGWDFEDSPAPSGRERSILTGPGPTLRRFVSGNHRSHDDALRAAFRKIGVLLLDGDPAADEPLHLIPIHVAALVCRQIADALIAGQFSNQPSRCPLHSAAIRALGNAQRDVENRRAKKMSERESLAVWTNIIAAIEILQLFDRVPLETLARLGRCQYDRCPRRRPFRLKRSAGGRRAGARPEWCEGGGCRARILEQRRELSTKSRYNRPAIKTKVFTLRGR